MATTDQERAKVARALRDYDEDYLTCRNLGHRWTAIGFYRSAYAGEVRRRLECERCGGARIDRWEARGVNRIGASYSYHDGYRLPGSQPTASAVRVEVVRRATVFASEDEMLAALTNGAGS